VRLHISNNLVGAKVVIVALLSLNGK